MSYNLNYNDNKQNETDMDAIVPQHPVDQTFVANYIAKVYGWMFMALCVTAATAFYVSTNETILGMILVPDLYFLAYFLHNFFSRLLSIRIQKMSSGTATAVFLGYSVLTGVTFSAILLAYSATTLVTTFGVTAATFGVMSAVGYFTKKDLTSFGRLMFMGLIGIIIASVVNFFTKSPALYWIISYVGVAVFVGLIAYDTQKIKQYAYIEDEETRKKGAIMGALALYLDFINLFLMLLRIFGRRD